MNIQLSKMAEFMYLNSDPLKIQPVNIDGEIRYNLIGIIDRNDLTEQEVNETLESLYEEVR